MARKGEGCQWQRPGFSVFMHTTEQKEAPCYKCVNNKYYGGSEEVCNACVEYANFKAKGDKE